MSYTSVRTTHDRAIDDLKAFISANGLAFRTPETLAQVPHELRSRLQEFQRRYDPSEHAFVRGKNVGLMKGLDFADIFADFDSTWRPKETETQILCTDAGRRY